MSSNGVVWAQDQAAGLRNLFRPRPTLAVAFAAGQPGLGCTRVVSQVALALATRGEATLMLDEHSHDRNIAATFGVGYRFDLAQALTGDIALSRAMVPVTESLNMLAAVRAGRFMRQNAGMPSQHMQATLAQLRKDHRYVLVDSCQAEGSHPLSPLGQSSAQVVLVVADGATALTGSYAIMKRFAAVLPAGRLQIVVNRCRTQEEAQLVFTRLQGVARQHLGLDLEWLGWVPFDVRWRDSLRVEVPAQSPAAQACDELAASLMRLAEGEPGPGAGKASPDLWQGVAA